MNESEFDRFADEYRQLHANVITASGETPDFFADYKIKDLMSHAKRLGTTVKRVLDFGCGVGTSTPYFKKYFPTAKIFGVDVSEKSLEIATSRYGDIASYSLMKRQIEHPSDTFDIVFASCVFHHIPRDGHDHWLAEITRVIKPGGFIAIFEHNPWNPLTVRAVNNCEFDENAELMTPFYLKSALDKLGYRKPRHDYRIFFPRIFSYLRGVEPTLRLLPLGAQYSVTAQK